MKNDEFKAIAASAFSGILSGAVFLILLFAVKWGIVISLVISAGTFAGMSLVTRPRRKIGGVSIEDIPNGEEIERRLGEAKEDFSSIETSIKKITDINVKSQAEKLVSTASGIIAYLEEHPEKVKNASQFIDYYQDTASKLLKRFVELQKTRLETPEISGLKQKTYDSLVTLNKAFDEQFQKLMRSEMFDMDAEIRLLEQVTKTENIDK